MLRNLFHHPSRHHHVTYSPKLSARGANSAATFRSILMVILCMCIVLTMLSSPAIAAIDEFPQSIPTTTTTTTGTSSIHEDTMAVTQIIDSQWYFGVEHDFFAEFTTDALVSVGTGDKFTIRFKDLTASEAQDSHVNLRITHPPSSCTVGYIETIFIQLGSSVSHSSTELTITLATISVSLGSKTMQITCSALVLGPSDSDSTSEHHRVLSATPQVVQHQLLGDKVHIMSTITIVDPPSITSHFHWVPYTSTNHRDRDTPDEIHPYTGEIGVKFTVYLPTTIPLSQDGLALHHPLLTLDLTTGDEPQDPAEAWSTSSYSDARVLYNLLPHLDSDHVCAQDPSHYGGNGNDNTFPSIYIRLRHDPDNPATIFFNLPAPSPSSGLGSYWVCTFTMFYPPDVLAAQFPPATMELPRPSIVVPSLGTVKQQQEPIPMPSNIPVLLADWSDEDAPVTADVLPPLMIWRSPYHSSTPDAFEFGIVRLTAIADGTDVGAPVADSDKDITLRLQVSYDHPSVTTPIDTLTVSCRPAGTTAASEQGNGNQEPFIVTLQSLGEGEGAGEGSPSVSLFELSLASAQQEPFGMWCQLTTTITTAPAALSSGVPLLWVEFSANIDGTTTTFIPPVSYFDHQHRSTHNVPRFQSIPRYVDQGKGTSAVPMYMWDGVHVDNPVFVGNHPQLSLSIERTAAFTTHTTTTIGGTMAAAAMTATASVEMLVQSTLPSVLSPNYIDTFSTNPRVESFHYPFLHLIFHGKQSIYNVLDIDSNASTPPTLTAHITITTPHSGDIVYDNHHVPIDFTTGDLPDQDPVEYSIDTFPDNPYAPIRAPSVIIPFHDVVLHPSQPLHVTVRFPVAQTLSDSTTITAVLLPYEASLLGRAYPSFARVTPVPSTPLVGYSYRCVKWDQMATTYVYGGGVEGSTRLTNEDSHPCPSYINPTTGLVDVETSDMWRRVEYRVPVSPLEQDTTPEGEGAAQDGEEDAIDTTVCLYELAAVCVTPSITNDGTYLVHPLAECPSLLDTIHAVPCSLALDRADWDYSVTGLHTSDVVALQPGSSSSSAEGGAGVTLYLGWTYRGDPRLALTVQVNATGRTTPHDGTDGNGNNMDHVMITSDWLTIRDDVPAYLSPRVTVVTREGNDEYTGIEIHLPFYLPQYVSTIGVQVFIPGVDSALHSVLSIPYPNGDSGEATVTCDAADGKHVHPTTLLCECLPGYTSSDVDVEYGVNNPMISPDDFTCVSLCDDGQMYDTESGTCKDDGDDDGDDDDDDDDDDEEEPTPPVENTCHSIPPDVLPPFQTKSCGYGVPTGDTCSECECFDQWVVDTSQQPSKCTRCALQYGDDDQRCMGDNHTDPDTFLPQYCWVGRCLCNHGYYGEKCQLKVMYGTINYLNVITEPEAEVPPPVAGFSILTRKQIALMQERILEQVRTAMMGDDEDDPNTPTTPLAEFFIQQVTQTTTVVDDGDADGDDNGDNTKQYQVLTSIVIAMLPTTSPSPEDGEEGEDPTPFIRLRAMSMSLRNDPTPTPTPTPPNEFGGLYDAWQQFQATGASSMQPDPEYGQLDSIASAYDPHCVPNEFTYCPDGENNLLPPKNQVDPDELEEFYVEDPDDPVIDNGDDDGDSNTITYIIIGTVLGIFFLLFILLIVCILYCRRHHKLCFNRKRRKRGAKGTSGHSGETAGSVELTGQVPVTSSGSTSTTAPTSATATGGSRSGAGGGITTSDASGASSNHIPTQVAIDDPTLPSEWIALQDGSTGKVYYSNKVTMESTWVHPMTPKDEEITQYGW